MISADVSELQWNRTAGLCGRLDDNPDNDWGHSDVTTEDNLMDFAQAWQANTIGGKHMLILLNFMLDHDSCN